MTEKPSYESLRAIMIDKSQNEASDALNSASCAVPVEGSALVYAAIGIGNALIAINGNLERIADTLDEMSVRQEGESGAIY